MYREVLELRRGAFCLLSLSLAIWFRRFSGAREVPECATLKMSEFGSNGQAGSLQSEFCEVSDFFGV